MRMLMLSAGLLALTAASGPAQAMEDYSGLNCLSHDHMTSYLDQAYGENRVASAELDNGNAIELFASRRGSWTLVEVQPDGQGCVQAHGERMRVDDAQLLKTRGRL